MNAMTLKKSSEWMFDDLQPSLYCSVDGSRRRLSHIFGREPRFPQQYPWWFSAELS